MTKEEAVKRLKVLAKDLGGYKPNKEMFDMAIKALEQPECEDAVSRFEVLRLIDYSSHDLNDSVDNRYMQNEIKQLPSVTPSAQPGWIPCTPKTMPPDYQWYYATCKSLVDNRENWVVEGWYTPWEHFNSTPMIKCGKAEVIAWMPKEFPEPWEGGQDDG